MAELKNKVQNALNECRILVLGAQVLFGFQFRSVLEPGFDGLPFVSKIIILAALGMLLVAIGLLISPSSYHRIVERGDDSEEIHRFTSKTIKWALLPFALALGLNLLVAANRIVGRKWAVAVGLLTTAAAIFFWYVIELYMRRERAAEISEAAVMDEKVEGKKDEGAKLSDKIEHVLTEARLILPGAQALLGFLFVAVLMESFDKLPDVSKYMHLASLLLIALTIILLMTPAAYHRIVERGEETEHFHRFASRMVVAALVPLALGISAAVYVVVQKVLESQLVAVVSVLVTLALFWELWFGLTLYRRTQRDHAR
ncbi:MAG: DUF6328 family protein [Acidobacteria bacterium]|nr:DUF6328 family protein [Acidobacteriota bacterium]